MLKLFCLGTLRLEVEAAPVTFTPRANALLLYLAVTRRTHSRDLLADLLWSDMNNQQARDNLRYLLPELRRRLRDYLVITAKDIAFNQQAPHWVDVAQLRAALTGQPDVITTPALQAALDLYQGEFLAGFSVRNAPVFEAWVVRQREELHALVVQSGYTLAERYWQQADYQLGLTATQRLLQWEPWHEAGHRLQMQLLVASGQRAAALEQYQQFRRLLQEEVGVEPAMATTALYEQIRRDEITLPASPAPATLTLLASTSEQVVVRTNEELPSPIVITFPRHNLPRLLTPFIGRQMELAALHAKLLDPAYPLLSLVGEGGIGKTRLALAAAQAVIDSIGQSGNDAAYATALLPSFKDGVWFVPLAGIAPGDELSERLAATVGETLGLAFAGREPLHKQLFVQLRHKRLLLILDNFEHLRDGASFVLELLQAAPSVKILLTSRHQLALQAEYSWVLDGLSFPTEIEAADMSERALLAYECIGLFVERARRARPNFHFDRENRTAVVQICHLLEGAPLGIELAATLVSRHSCSHIAAALADHYTILAANLQDIPAPHRTMQNVLHYSWQLLAPSEALTLACCAIFRGGFTQNAARSVAGATPELLASLLGHSLLGQTRDNAGQVRYYLHEVVRQYALEQLQMSATTAHLTAEQHCTYYTTFLAEQETPLQRSAHARYLIQADLDNVRTAWRWAVAQANSAALAQALACLSAFYEFVGFFQEAKTMLAQAIDALQSLHQTRQQPALALLLGRLLVEQAGFCVLLGHFAEACTTARTVIQLGEQDNNRYLQADGRRRLGSALRQMGELATAITVLEDGLAIARQEKLLRVMALCLHNIAMLRYQQGAYRAALACAQEGLAIAQQIGDQVTESPLAHNIGITYLVLGDFAQALRYLEQNIRTGRELGWQRLLAFATMNLGYLLAIVGEFTRAQTASAEALAIFVNLGCRGEEANTRAQLSAICRVLGDNEQAYALGLQALAIAEAENYALERGLALLTLGDTLVAMQRWQEAHYLYEQALAIWQDMGNADQIALVLSALAFVAYHQQQLDEALLLVERILPALNNVSVDGTQNFLVCYRILTARHDPRAAAVLRQGYAFIQAQCATLQDEHLRHSFLTQVAVNRELITLAQQAGIDR